MLYWIYQLPLSYVVTGMIACIFLWTALYHKNIAKGYRVGSGSVCRWYLFNAVIFLASLAAIVYITVLSRQSDVSKLVLQPFYSIEVAKTHSEMYRSLLMNVALFLPLGLSFSCLLSTRISVPIRILATSLLGAFVSIVIESLQYFYSLGETWTDDVICNTSGAFLGSMALVAWKLYYIRKFNFS